MEKFKGIIESYHHLKYYLPPVTQNRKEAEIKRHHGRDTSCCAFLFLILLLATAAFVIGERRNVENEFWTSQMVRTCLAHDYFYNITDSTTANEYIMNNISEALFTNTSRFNLLGSYVLVGPLVFRQVRSLERSCPRSDLDIASTYKCYYFNTKSSEKYTSTIGVGQEDWRQYQSSTAYKSSYSGEFGDYDSSGYIQEFSNNNSDSFITDYQDLLDQGWLSGSTRAIFISCNLYEPSYDLWVVVALVLEYNTNGYVNPTQFDITAMKVSLLDVSSGANTADVFKILFSLYILYIYIGNILEVKDGKRNIRHAFSFQGNMDLLLVIMVIFSVVLSLWINENESDLYKNDKFVDLSSMANYYKLYHNINTMTLILIIIRILLLFSVNKRVYILITMIQYSARDIMNFLLILVAVYVTLSMISQSIWGVQIYNYHNFIYSIVNLFLILIGHGDFENMIEVTLAWSFVFLAVYFLFIFSFLLSSFCGIFIESYKVIRLVEGYTDDTTNWSKTDILMWFIDWLPYVFKKNLLGGKEKNEEPDKENEKQDEENQELS